MNKSNFIIFLWSICIISGQRQSVQRSDVYIAGFFPYGDGVENAQTGMLLKLYTKIVNIQICKLNLINYFIGRGVMPSVKLALDHVNEHSNILRNYRLHMWWNDTEVN